MKLKILLVIPAFIVTTIKVYCQQKQPSYTFKIFAGYFAGSDKISPMYGSIGVNNAQGSIKEDKNGLGSGLHLGVSLEKNFGKLIIAGIDGDYFVGKKINSSDSYNYQNYQVGNITFYGDSLLNNIQLTHTVISIIPHIIFKVLPLKNNYLYTRMGVIIALNTKLAYMQQDYEYSNQQTSTTILSNRYQYGVNLGFQAGAGISCHVKGNLRIYAELIGNYLPVRPKSNYENGTRQGFDGTNTIYNYHIYYRNASSGPAQTTISSTTTGNTTTETATFHTGPSPQHINSGGLTVGLQVGIK